MKINPLPENEALRLAALRQYGILDTADEQDFEDLVSLAAVMFGTPIAVITFIDEQRQWFKAKRGIDFKETSRRVSFCSHTILTDGIKVIFDASRDELFAANPLVIDAPHIRFYAGIPLTTCEGFRIGALAVMDNKPMSFSGEKLSSLKLLAKQTMKLLDQRLKPRTRIPEQKSAGAHGREVFAQLSDTARLVMNSSLDAIICIDKKGVVTFWNKQAESIFGWGHVEAVGRELSELIIPDRFRGRHKAGLEHYLKTGEAVMLSKLMETTALNREKVEFPIELTIIPVSENGSEFFYSFIRDISARKESEKILIGNEKRFRALIENSADGLTVISREGIVLELSPSAKRILGYNPSEIIGRFRADIIHPLDLSKVISAFRNIVQNDSMIETLEYRHMMPDGTYKWLECTFNNLLHEPTIQAVVLNYHDITERKKAVETIRLAEERYRHIFENTLEGIYQSTPDGRFITANPAMAKMFGYATPQDLVASVTDIATQLYVDPRERERMKALVEKEGFANGFELKALKKNKEEMWVRAHIRAIKNGRGKIEYFEGTIEDISERKEAEDKLNSQFEQLQKTNYELDRFVYSVSHDLRAPLASILGLINVAEIESPSGPQLKYLAMIRSSVNKLDGFIKDILNYSRNARTDMRIEKINFSEMIGEIQNSLRQLTGAARLEVTLDIDDKDPYCSDRTRLEIIFNNILSNAIKYQDYSKEESRLLISVKTSPEDVVICCTDNGVGVREGHLDKIFNMFYRASDLSKGSGLGLYITKETVIKLGGWIKAESQLGLFTTFEIVIPNLRERAS
jgi:PAS domain S-box-containing protein